MKACMDVVDTLSDFIEQRKKLDQKFADLNIRNMEDMISNEHKRADYLGDERRDIEEASYVQRLEHDVIEMRQKVAERELILLKRQENFIIWQFNEHCQKENAALTQSTFSNNNNNNNNDNAQGSTGHFNPRYTYNNNNGAVMPHNQNGMITVTSQNCDSYRPSGPSPPRRGRSPLRPHREQFVRSSPNRGGEKSRNGGKQKCSRDTRRQEQTKSNKRRNGSPDRQDNKKQKTPVARFHGEEKPGVPISNETVPLQIKITRTITGDPFESVKPKAPEPGLIDPHLDALIDGKELVDTTYRRKNDDDDDFDEGSVETMEIGCWGREGNNSFSED